MAEKTNDSNSHKIQIFEGQTVHQMAELFGRDKSVIGKHVRACFKEGELKKESVWAKFAYTAKDGKGYRVKSQRGTQFRICTTF